MPAGRPTDYKPELIDAVYEYCESYEDFGDTVPTKEGFAVYLGVSKKTLYNWANNENLEDSDKFLHALEYLDSLQGKLLVNGGLSKKYDSPITRLMLSNHGYKEKSDITSDDKPIESGVVILPSKE